MLSVVMTPKVIQRIVIAENPSCVMPQLRGLAGAWKDLGAAQVFSATGSLRPISILTGNGGTVSYVANASLATGVYETINNFICSTAESTVFEYYRKDLNRPLNDVWVVAPSVGFERIGESSHSGYGPAFGANVILPKRLLAAALPVAARGNFESLLHDNYESPVYAPQTANIAELARIEGVLSVSDFLREARNAQSPDELSVFWLIA